MTHHVRKHINRFSVELAQHIMPAYRGAAYPQHNPKGISGAAETADLPTAGHVVREVAERLAACVEGKLDMNKKPFAAYSPHELRTSWRKRRLMKERLDRVSSLIANQMQIIKGHHQGQLPTDEAMRAVEEMRRHTLQMLQDRAASTTCDRVALIPVNLSRETLLDLEAVNQKFPTFGRWFRLN